MSDSDFLVRGVCARKRDKLSGSIALTIGLFGLYIFNSRIVLVGEDLWVLMLI